MRWGLIDGWLHALHVTALGIYLVQLVRIHVLIIPPSATPRVSLSLSLSTSLSLRHSQLTVIDSMYKAYLDKDVFRRCQIS